MLSFAALSPYLYVFRSRKVQKCLGQVLHDTFCIWELSLVQTRRRNLVAHQASLRNQVRNRSLPVREQDRKCQHHIGKCPNCSFVPIVYLVQIVYFVQIFHFVQIVLVQGVQASLGRAFSA